MFLCTPSSRGIVVIVPMKLSHISGFFICKSTIYVIFLCAWNILLNFKDVIRNSFLLSEVVHGTTRMPRATYSSTSPHDMLYHINAWKMHSLAHNYTSSYLVKRKIM